MKTLTKVLLWKMAILALVHAAHAATLAGRVLDPDGRPVAAIRLTAELGSQSRTTTTDRDGGLGSQSRTTTTDRDGGFELSDLAPGVWYLRIEATGFEPIERSLTLTGTEAAAVELRLTPSIDRPIVRQEIVVTSELPELDTEEALSMERLDATASKDLALSLRDQAGIAANRRGPINLEPTVRGLQETQVGMFVDGTRTFAAGPARMDSDLSHISPHAVDSVQVVKGPYALTWGAGTLSAVEVKTFTPELTGGRFSVNGKVQTNYGDNAGNTDGYAGIWGASDRLAFSVLYNDRQGNDYQDGDGRTVPGNYRSADTRWSLQWRTGEGSSLHYSGGYQGQDDLDYPGRILDATYFKTRSHDLEYRWQRPGSAGGGVTELYAQVYTNFKDHRMNNDDKPTAQPNPGRVPPFALDIGVTTESNTTGGRMYFQLGRGDWSWKVGGDFYRSAQDADRTVARRADGQVLFQDVVWPDARIDDLGGYGQAIYRGDTYQIGVTVRADRVDSSAGRPSPFFLANSTGDLDRQDGEISAAISGRFRLTDQMFLSAGVGRAVRAPNVLERYSDRFPSTKFQLPAEFLGTPDLRPEDSLEADLGVEASAGRLTVGVDLFWRRIDDYITVEPDPSVPRRLPLSPPTVFRYINGSGAVFYGGELDLRHPLGAWLSWRGALSWLWAEDRQFDEPALGIPPLTARTALRVAAPRGPWWTELEAIATQRQDRVAEARFEVPTAGYTVFDLRGGLSFARRWEARAGIENVTDKAYAVHLDAKNPFTGERIREPGRNFYLGLGVDF